jgi:hypothetical protein
MQYFDLGDYVITFAVTDPEKSLREGITCFLVDRNTDGLITNSAREEMQRKGPLIEPIILKFNRCKVPVNSILGEIGHAFSLGVKWLPFRRIVRAARCVGVGKRLLEICSEYAKTWEMFGRAISGQTRVQHILADMAIYNNTQIISSVRTSALKMANRTLQLLLQKVWDSKYSGFFAAFNGATWAPLNSSKSCKQAGDNALAIQTLLKFADFWNTHKPELIATEYHLFSDNHEYAGTADLVIRLNNQVWLLDIKTSN